MNFEQLLSKCYLILFIIINITVFQVNSRESPIHIDVNYYNDQIIQPPPVVRVDCQLDVHEDTINPQPLLLKPGTNQFYDPNSNGIINIPFGRPIELFCGNKFNGKFDGKTRLYPICVGNKRFLVNGQQYDFSDFVCKSWTTFMARRTGDHCHGGASVVEVGFNVTNRFIKTFDLCHDEHLESTLYVHHLLSPASAHHQSGISRVNFREGDFYNGKNVDKLYTQVVQKNTIGGILNGDHEKYFDEKKSLFFARGHLSAKADHIYGSQQRATFYFINAAPQWQVFNAGNWQTIEDDVRRFVGEQRKYLECYTGTWGVGTLADSNGVHRELYLYMDEYENALIPVPMLYYRVVIEPATKRGIVLIGVNNPHLTLEEIQRDYIICEDISDMITWIKWKKDNILLGYSYACEVNEFAEVVGHLPPLHVTDILY